MSRCKFLINSNAVITTKQTLGRTERLKSRKIIEQLFKDGRAVSSFPIRISYKLVDSPESSLQAGFSTSSRTFKKAVDRNRIKRLLRENYRKQKAELNELLIVSNRRLAIFIIYTGKELPAYVLVEEKMKLALKKLIDQLKVISNP